jgi:hypothetical protein
MSLPELNHQQVQHSDLVGLVDIEGFCGGPTMVFKNDRLGGKQPAAPSMDGSAAQKAAAVDLSASLKQLYDQAMRLGHVEAALFIGCANLSVSETLAMDGLSTPGSKAVPTPVSELCGDD